MRKGYNLIELLTVIAIMVAVAFTLNTLFRTLVSDIPHLQKMLNENIYIQNMVDQLQHDIDGARSLRQDEAAADPNHIDEAPIIIELSHGTVCYLQREDAIVRRILDPVQPLPSDPNELDPNERIWHLDRAKVKWRVWRRQGSGYAVEIRTHLENKSGSATQIILGNSRVFFLGVHPQEGILP